MDDFNRFYRIGEPGSGLKLRGEIQDYYKIREKCLETKTLFEDELFPADASTLDQDPKKDIVWKRPFEIHENPTFFINGPRRFDVIQGKLGDCWVLSAMSALTTDEALFNRVVPPNQSFTDDYAGIFYFRIWQFGKWIEVVVDDRIPVDRKTGRFCYIRSSSKNEFWSVLLEKAYAKLHGSYLAIISGWGRESMTDFTGGIAETFDPSILSESYFWKLLQKSKKRRSLMICAIIEKGEVVFGLLHSHAYTITGFGSTSTGVNLVRIRNPWGSTEWKGPWSDKSEEWNTISEKDREELEFTKDDDGEFWICTKDFLECFNSMEICNLTPELLKQDMSLEERGKHWDIQLLHGKWVSGITCGGPDHTNDVFARNPQYRIVLTDPDPAEDEDRCDCLCTVMICLMQKYRRIMRKANMAMGFSVYKIPESHLNVKPLDADFLKREPVCQHENFVGKHHREIIKSLRLPAGTYCVIPYTQNIDVTGEFLIRVYAVKNTVVEVNEEPVRIVDVDPVLKEEIEISDTIKNGFNKHADEHHEVNAERLMSLYVDVLMKDIKCVFTSDMFRSMIAMMDIDHSGKLDYNEFLLLVRNLKLWTKVFRLYDIDNSGNMNVEELQASLRAAGYVVNKRILTLLVHRYGSEGSIELNNFIHCLIRFKTIIDLFSVKSPNDQQLFSLDEWIASVIIC